MAFVPIAALALNALSGITSAISTIQSAKSSAATYNYQSQVAAENEKTAENNLEYTLNAGEQKAQDEGKSQRARLGQIEANQAASGTDVNSGSNVDVRASQAATDVQSTATSLHNTAMTAYGYETQAYNYGTQSSLYKSAAKNATSNLPLQVASGLLGSASSLASKWTNFDTSGAFKN